MGNSYYIPKMQDIDWSFHPDFSFTKVWRRRTFGEKKYKNHSTVFLYDAELINQVLGMLGSRYITVNLPYDHDVYLMIKLRGEE